MPSTTAPSVVREPCKEVLLVSGPVSLAARPLLVVLTLSPLLLLLLSDRLSVV